MLRALLAERMEAYPRMYHMVGTMSAGSSSCPAGPPGAVRIRIRIRVDTISREGSGMSSSQLIRTSLRFH